MLVDIVTGCVEIVPGLISCLHACMYGSVEIVIKSLELGIHSSLSFADARPERACFCGFLHSQYQQCVAALNLIHSSISVIHTLECSQTQHVAA